MQQNNKDNTQATMKDVALAAGVSTATVSRTLMNPEKYPHKPVRKLNRLFLMWAITHITCQRTLSVTSQNDPCDRT